MVKQLQMKMLLLVAMLMGWGVSAGAAQVVTFSNSDFEGQGTSGSGSAITATKEGVTFACNKGYGTTQIRCYSGGEITISSSSPITKIEFTFSGTYTGGLDEAYNDLSNAS
ncbi:MAG: hypothetical protein IJ892_12170 [Prevotella sp.]|nr:hypothetical protein [Prevotella sp.]